MHRNAVPFLVLLPLGIALGGCEMFQMKGVVRTTTTIDGKTETKEREFHSFAEMPQAFSDAADDVSSASAKIAAKLIEAPPPGKVKLSDLSPALKDYEGKPDLDFLAHPEVKEGKKPTFTYVRIGVPSYDEFFKKTAEMYALVYQTKQMVFRMRELSARVAGAEKPDPTAALHAAVMSALQLESTEHQAERKLLDDYRAMTSMLAQSTVALAQKTQEIVAAGQQLIAGAPSSITNPKTALHIDLIVEGLEQSCALIKESGSLLVDIGGEISPFG